MPQDLGFSNSGLFRGRWRCALEDDSGPNARGQSEVTLVLKDYGPLHGDSNSWSLWSRLGV